MPISKQLLENRRIDVLFDQSQGSLITVTLASIITSFVYWNYADSTVILAWLSSYLVFNAFRHYHVHQYNSHRKELTDKHHWLHYHIAGVAVSGALWGGIGVYFIHVSPPDYASLMSMLAGYLVIGAASTYAVLLSVYLAYTLPLVVPIIFYHLAQANLVSHTYGLLLLIFYAFSLYSAYKHRSREIASLSFQYDNESLLLNLQGEKSEAARLNRELEVDLSRLKQAEEQLKKEKEKAEELAQMLLTLSSQDGLTGIANRRHFDDFLAKEWNRALRSRKPLSLILCDIDHFKAYNDCYGHQQGDKCLLRIAHTLDQYARRGGDLAARYGGEEFAIVLPETNLSNAAEIAEQIREAVENIAMPHAASQTSNVVTVSFGVATIIPNRNRQSRMLVALADKALYEAKQKGRNRIVSSTPELVSSTDDAARRHPDAG